jgi:hypothetical protein
LSLVDWSVIKSKRYQRQLVKTPRGNMHPRMVEFSLKFNLELQKRGVPFYVFEFHRSAERQNDLKAGGLSKASGGRSPHQWGFAFDLVHCTKYWDLTPKQWAFVGAIGKEVARRMKLKVVWGGDWDFYDPAHWQLANWKEFKSQMIENPFQEWPDQHISYKLRCASVDLYYEPDNYGWYCIWIEKLLRKSKRK